MITISVLGILKKSSHYSLRFIVGIFTVLFGVLISYLMLTFANLDYELHVKIGIQLVPFWIMFYGFYELTIGISSLRKLEKRE